MIAPGLETLNANICKWPQRPRGCGASTLLSAPSCRTTASVSVSQCRNLTSEGNQQRTLALAETGATDPRTEPEAQRTIRPSGTTAPFATSAARNSWASAARLPFSSARIGFAREGDGQATAEGGSGRWLARRVRNKSEQEQSTPGSFAVREKSWGCEVIEGGRWKGGSHLGPMHTAR